MIQPRRRASAAIVGLVTAILVLATPGIVLAAADWTITRSPASLMALSTTNFSLVATNIGSGRRANAIGCVIVSIPSQFNVNSATVTNASGHIWTASVAGGGSGAMVTVQASANSQRLSANKVESVSFTINVTGLIPGAYQWTADAFIGFDCSGTYAQPIAMTVTIGALPINLPPVAVADLVTVPEDGTLVTPAPGLLANDLDADGDPLSAQLVTSPLHGTLALAADGSFKYVPVADYAGADSFTYRVSDGAAVSLSAVVSVTVTPVNDAPVAAADSYSVDQGSTLVRPAPGVLANDGDVDGPLMTAQLVAQPAHGTLSLLATGSFTYTPDAGYSGGDSFQYRASDGSASSAPATVSLTVIPRPGTGTSSPLPTAAPTQPGASPRATPSSSPGSSPGESPLASATPRPDGSLSTSPGPDQSGGPAASGSAAPTLALTVARAPDGPIAPISLDFAFAGMQFDWFIPGLAIGVPGLLVIAAIALQLVGALAWLPAVRRFLGASGHRRRTGRST